MAEHDREVEEVVREWLAAKQAADADGIARRLSAYKGALAVGTGAGEWWSGADRFAEAHTGGGPFTLAVSRLEAHREGRVAWAAVDGEIAVASGDGAPIRLTLVLVEGLDGWRVVQSHASAPA